MTTKTQYKVIIESLGNLTAFEKKVEDVLNADNSWGLNGNPSVGQNCIVQSFTRKYFDKSIEEVLLESQAIEANIEKTRSMSNWSVIKEIDGGQCKTLESGLTEEEATELAPKLGGIVAKAL